MGKTCRAWRFAEVGNRHLHAICWLSKREPGRRGIETKDFADRDTVVTCATTTEDSACKVCNSCEKRLGQSQASEHFKALCEWLKHAQSSASNVWLAWLAICCSVCATEAKYNFGMAKVSHKRLGNSLKPLNTMHSVREQSRVKTTFAALWGCNRKV